MSLFCVLQKLYLLSVLVSLTKIKIGKVYYFSFAFFKILMVGMQACQPPWWILLCENNVRIRYDFKFFYIFYGRRVIMWWCKILVDIVPISKHWGSILMVKIINMWCIVCFLFIWERLKLLSCCSWFIVVFHVA